MPSGAPRPESPIPLREGKKSCIEIWSTRCRFSIVSQSQHLPRGGSNPVAAGMIVNFLFGSHVLSFDHGRYYEESHSRILLCREKRFACLDRNNTIAGIGARCCRLFPTFASTPITSKRNAFSSWSRPRASGENVLHRFPNRPLLHAVFVLPHHLAPARTRGTGRGLWLTPGSLRIPGQLFEP